MKSFVLFLIVFIGFSVGCDTEKICPDITYKHRVMMYVKLKQGMSLQFDTLDSLEFIPFKTYYYSPSYTMDSRIISSGGESDYLYPGNIKSYDENSRFPIYDNIYNQAEYEKICNEVGDNISSKFCYNYSPNGPFTDPSYLNLYFGVLYNKLDSIKIICTDKDFGHYPQGSSLNDTFMFSCIVIDPKIAYPGDAWYKNGRGLPSKDRTKKPYYLDEKLSDYFRATQGTRFLSITGSSGFALSSVTNSINSTPPRIYLPGAGRVNKEAYRFKLFFYMDDGQLVVESNEIVGYY